MRRRPSPARCRPEQPRGRARRGSWAAALCALGALLVGCANGTGDASIVLYSGQHPQLTEALVTAFTRQSGIRVSVRSNDGIVLADQLLQEGKSSPADVYLTENSPELVTLGERGLLAPLAPSTLGQIPRTDDSPTGQWVGVALRVSSLAYDPALVSRSNLPPSMLDLAQSRWKGKVAIAPTDSDFPPLVGAAIATYGEAAARRWLVGLKGNAQTFQDEEAVTAAVNRGAVAMGLVNQYYWYRLRLETGAGAMHSALYYFANHDAGSVENISGAAVLASSRHRQAAEKLVGFLVSAAGQQIIASSDDFEYPARTGIASNPALPPLATVAPTTLSVVALGDDQLATRLIQQAGLV